MKVQYYFLIFLFFYLFGICMRYAIGTTHDERMQTSLKLKRLNHITSIALFLSCSKKPVALHCILLQALNFCVLFISTISSMPLKTTLDIYCCILFLSVIIPLFVEAVIMAICLKGKWKDCGGKITADFVSGEYVFINNNKPVSGYLDRYLNGKCAFFDEENSLVFEGNISYDRKSKKVFMKIKDKNENLCLEKID